MFDTKELLGFLAGILGMAGYIPYYQSILNRRTQPSRTSWWIWSMTEMLLASSYFFSGGRTAFWLFTGYAAGGLGVAVLSLRYGHGGSGKLDALCILAALVGGFLWLTLKNPVITLYMSMTTMAVAALPTLRKTWLNPSSENKSAWLLFSISGIINLFSIKECTLNIVLSPVLAALCNSILSILTFRIVKNNPIRAECTQNY